MDAAVLKGFVFAVHIYRAFAAAHDCAAFRAADKPCENIYPAGIGRLGIARENILHTIEHIIRNDGGDIIGDAVHFADVGLIHERLFYHVIGQGGIEFSMDFRLRRSH